MPEGYGKEIRKRLAKTFRFQSTDMKTLEQIEYEYFLKHAHQPATMGSVIDSLHYKLFSDDKAKDSRTCSDARKQKMYQIKAKFGR